MIVKEIRIGDYVNYRGQIIKVTSLYDKGGSNEVGWSDKESVWVNADNVEPIPLTPEILEKNGFSKSRLMGEQRHFTYYLAPSVSLLAIYDADFSLCIGDCARYIKYVHELQHALRLCGIDKEIEL